MKHSVMLDTSFFIRLLNDEDALHSNAVGYFKYFLENEINLRFPPFQLQNIVF
jgi:predicted nucleic acid-binding protein